jgi:hypothetical protein
MVRETFTVWDSHHDEETLAAHGFAHQDPTVCPPVHLSELIRREGERETGFSSLRAELVVEFFHRPIAAGKVSYRS